MTFSARTNPSGDLEFRGVITAAERAGADVGIAMSYDGESDPREIMDAVVALNVILRAVARGKRRRPGPKPLPP